MRRIKRALSSLGDAAWEWMNDHKYVSVFFSGVIIDFWANWYSYAIVQTGSFCRHFSASFYPS